MSSPTPNKGMTYPAHGGAVNAWDSPLDANFDQLDLNLGGYYPIVISSTIVGLTFFTSYAAASSTVATITPNTSNAQNVIYQFSGTMGSTVTLVMPQVGSFYVVDNRLTTGNFTVQVNTVGGTSAVTIPQGTVQMVYTSTVASNSVELVGNVPQAKLYTYLGTPQGNISGTAGSANASLTDVVWDTTDQQIYVCTTTGTSTSAVFTPTLGRLVPEGYITLSTDANNPILTGDAASKTAVYYTPFMGGWTLLSNGTALYPYQFTQMQLALTAGGQAANNIYDVFIYNSTAGPTLGTGPAWTNSGAGTGARGSGAGTTQLARLNGVWTNAVQANLTNGTTVLTCPANQGVYLGSIFMDGTAGQVSCLMNYGQNRKWGVWNNYNRANISLKAGDPSTSWTYNSSAIRPSNGSSQNTLFTFSGLAEEVTQISFLQQIAVLGNHNGNAYTMLAGVGMNSTNTFSGTIGQQQFQNQNTNGISAGGNQLATHTVLPSLGMQQAISLESAALGGGANLPVFSGQESGMRLYATWRG